MLSAQRRRLGTPANCAGFDPAWFGRSGRVATGFGFPAKYPVAERRLTKTTVVVAAMQR